MFLYVISPAKSFIFKLLFAAFVVVRHKILLSGLFLINSFIIVVLPVPADPLINATDEFFKDLLSIFFCAADKRGFSE